MLNPAQRRLRKFLIIAGVSVAGVAVLIAVLVLRLSPLSQRWAFQALSKYYKSDVTLESFHVTLYPHILASGGGLVLRDRTQPGGPPMISVKQFSLEATWLALLRHPRRVRHVRLEGLTINVLRRQPQGTETTKKKHHLPPLYFTDIEADATTLNTYSSDPQKPPRVFRISKLRLQSVGVGKAMSFQATLTNPKPIGEIRTVGKFGPWNPDEPGHTPVSGRYDFHDADLATIRGLAGILSSVGTFDGVLDRIDVDGTTDTPSFSLGPGGNAESLKTQFHAVVDGETGQTLLQPVRAVLGQSLIIARGGVLRTPGASGTTVLLDVNTESARLSDLLSLAVKSSKPPMSGDISIQTRFEVSPGTEQFEERLGLNGSFTIKTARFTDPEVEEKVTHLSERGKGNPDAADGEKVASNFGGRFTLARGVMSFSRLSFDVPGASVDIKGTYGLMSEELNFLGTLQLQAKPSEMTTGIKSMLLKAVDPLLKGKHSGTDVPIKISGDRQHPKFGVEYSKLLKRLGM